MGQTEKDPGQAETVSNKRKKTGGKIAMKKMRRFLLVLLMIAAVCFCVSAVAETSGSCGDNVSWTLSDDGVLRISGTGMMSDYFEGGGESEAIKIVIIEDGVTSIGKYAFRGCSSLTSITIPESVTYIGNHAFFRCSSLTSITIPDGVTEIGEHAFDSCSSLTSITIPDGVTEIGVSTFEVCSSLTSITIPDGVTVIGEAAFNGCYSLTSITIPYGVTVIGESTFNACSSLTSITIPESVTYIRKYAFSGCSSLTSITIPDGVTEIGEYAFQACSGLTNITLPDSVTSIGGGAFNGCNSLTSITIPESVTSIEDGAFQVCSSLTSITIPNSVTSIGGFAFNGCSSLTSITIPDSVTEIGRRAFSGCSSLTNITIPDSVTSIGASAFSGCSRLTGITIPEGVTVIGIHVFSGCSCLTSITIPEGVTSIGNSAFFACSRLTSITIPGSVTEIGDLAFSECHSLKNITIPEGVTHFGDYLFKNSGLKSILLPRSLSSAGYLYINPNTATVYCYEFTYAEKLAKDNRYKVVLLDDPDVSISVQVELPAEIQILVGRKQRIDPDIFPRFSSQKITWNSSRPDILSIDDAGVFTAVKEGESIVTVNVDGVSASTVVHVGPQINKIILPEEILVAVKSQGTFEVGILPTNAAVDFSYEVEDTNLAQINENRIISANVIGETTVTVSDKLSGKKEKTKLIICYPVTAIELSPVNATMKSEESLQINAHVTMRTQTCENQLVTYSSSDENIATVDKNGMVTAKQAGQVIITATAASGVSASSQITVISQYLPGDVNDDGAVDGRDVLRLMKYLAGEEDPETGEPIEINEDNADVDGSGTVDEKDLLRLIRYLGGEEVELLPGAISGNG